MYLCYVYYAMCTCVFISIYIRMNAKCAVDILRERIKSTIAHLADSHPAEESIENILFGGLDKAMVKGHRRLGASGFQALTRKLISI